MKQLCALLLLFFFATSANGQDRTNAIKNNQPKILKTKNVSKYTSIGCGIQDRYGNIWFGSNGTGVYRYDGKSFTDFTIKEGLDNNTVYSILEDNAGNIWVGTQTGLNRYNGKTFTNIPITLNDDRTFFGNHPNSNSTSAKNGVWSMMQDKSGIIWFGTDADVYRYNGKNFSRFLDDPAISNKEALQLKAIFSIIEDRNGNFWFGACVADGVSRFDGKTLTNIVPQKEVGRVNRIIEDKNGNLWFTTTWNNVCYYDGKIISKNFFSKRNGTAGLMILEDKTGNIWFDTNEGLGCYNGKTLKVLSEKNGLPAKRLYPILEDRLGNIWFSADGMDLYSWDGKRFNKFSK